MIRASDGRDYSKPELDRMIQLRQQVVTSIDPLISQLLNRLVTAVRPLIDDPTKIPTFLDKLFTDMLAKNDEVSRKNRSDIEYAFEHGQIHRVDRTKPPSVQIAETQVWGWSLSGIHALAHRHVGVHFNHDPFYNAAVDRLIGQEYYWRTFVEDMIFVFGIALTIVCPPLGAAASFAANLALGLNKLEKAEEQETIYGALIDPEQVLNYAELQVELFIARLQVGLSFLELLPGAGKGVKALTGLGKTAARGGASKLAKEALVAELEQLSRMASENFLKALAIELVQETVEDKVIDLLIGPIIEAHIKELERELHDEGLL